MKSHQLNYIIEETVASRTEIHKFYGSPIAFTLQKELMVNATQMAKPFDKSPNHFLRNAQTEAFIFALQNRNLDNEPVTVINGGNNPGTWMHQKLALKFAAWLSPEFELWIFDRIEELLTTGKTELPNHQSKIPQTYAEALRLAADQADQIEAQQSLIEAAKPKVEAYHELMTCTNAISMKELAGVLAVPGMGRNNLFLYLRKRRVLTPLNEPYQEYINRGWFKLKQSPWKNPHTGERKVTITTEVMPAGVDGIRKMLRKEGY